jgi:Amt family ammonium transporter
MVLLGTALLWVGWFGFNAGSALSANALAAHAFGTTFFASASAMVAWMLVDFYRKGKASAVGAGVGAVAGLVCITPAAGFVTLGASLAFGLISGVVCNYACTFIREKTKLDDTLDVIGCHGVGGTLGTFLTATFASKAVNSSGADGLLYGSSDLFLAHLMGTLYIFALSAVGTYVAFKISDVLFGMRVSEKDEEQGLDKSQHDELITNLTADVGQSSSHEHKKAA